MVSVHPVHLCICVGTVSSGYCYHRNAQARTVIDWSVEATKVSVESYRWLPGFGQCYCKLLDMLKKLKEM